MRVLRKEYLQYYVSTAEDLYFKLSEDGVPYINSIDHCNTVTTCMNELVQLFFDMPQAKIVKDVIEAANDCGQLASRVVEGVNMYNRFRLSKSYKMEELLFMERDHIPRAGKYALQLSISISRIINRLPRAR